MFRGAIAWVSSSLDGIAEELETAFGGDDIGFDPVLTAVAGLAVHEEFEFGALAGDSNDGIHLARNRR